MKSIYIVSLFFLMSCHHTVQVRNLNWKTGDSQNQLSQINKIEHKDVSQIIYKGHKITHSYQTYLGNDIASTSLKKTFDRDGTIIQAEANFFDDQDLSKIRNLDLSEKIKNRVTESLLKQHADLKIDTLKTTVATRYLKSDLIYLFKAQFELPDGQIIESFFDKNLNLIDENSLGSKLSALDSTVYELGPKFSGLKDVTLQVEKTPLLSNSTIFVDSQSETKITSVNSSLKFDPKDERFEQVQVFYYMNKLRSWVSEKLDIQFIDRIDVEVNVGYPKKTNTAFYFQNKIRLGRGDEVDYINIALDPSIVLHEGFHGVIDGLANLPFEGQGGSLNEGFADFYTCVMLNRPFLGETAYLKAPYKRSVSNDLKLSDMNQGLYHDSGIISGLLWEIKNSLGEELTLKIVTAALAQLNHFSQFSDFNDALVLQINSQLPADKKLVVGDILKRRGFKYE